MSITKLQHFKFAALAKRNRLDVLTTSEYDFRLSTIRLSAVIVTVSLNIVCHRNHLTGAPENELLLLTGRLPCKLPNTSLCVVTLYFALYNRGHVRSKGTQTVERSTQNVGIVYCRYVGFVDKNFKV